MEGVSKKPGGEDETKPEEVSIKEDEKKDDEKKQAEEPAAAPAAKLCLVLETDLRTWLRYDKLKHKKGHNRKLTKKEVEEVEEKVRFWHFDVQKYKESIVRSTIERMQDAPEFLPASAAEKLAESVRTEDEKKETN